jgi:nicotinamidase-related amidase
MPLLDRDDSVLVVVDAQAGFLNKVDAEVAADVVDRIRWLVLLAGKLALPVRVTEEEPERNDPTAGPIRSALPPGSKRHVKPTFGIAGTPEILGDLEATGRRTAVLVGLETDVCVAQSALGLQDSGWRVVVVFDAVASPGISHEQGLARLRDAGIELLGTKAVAYDWLRTVSLASEVLRLSELAPPRGIVL